MAKPSPLTSTLPSARLRVGDCSVDMPLREIHAPGARRPRRVTPKAIGVLAALIEQGGRVVSRDALLATVWAGTLPTDDVVTQAITQLRKAFDDERGNPRYIETIAKYGYRLLASVERLDAEVEGTGPDAVPSPSQFQPPFPQAPVTVRGDWRAMAAAVGVAAVLVAGMLGWNLLRKDTSPATAKAQTTALARGFRLITSFPGVEQGPSLSPDAALVAYVAVPPGKRRSAIMLQTTDPSTPRQLSHPEGEAEDSAPQWAPDGREIAFLRVTAGQDCKVLVMPANGGPERAVGVCDALNPPTFDWTHDGRGLVFSSRGTRIAGAGIKILSLANGAWRTLEYGATERDLDFAPRFSPDGRWIVFVRNSPMGDLWRIPPTGGPAQRLTRLHADIRGWDWLPDGRGIVLSRWSGSEARLLRLDLASGVLQDLGVDDAMQPSIARRSSALAFANVRNYFGVHRVWLDGKRPPEHLFPSSGRDRLATLAPDGEQLVFTSDRSGDFRVWWADLRRPESLRLIEGLRPESWLQPDWSPDSHRLLVVGAGEGGFGLYEVAPASGQVVHLPSPESEIVQAVYVPGDEGRLLLIAGSDSGRPRLLLFDRRNQPWRQLAMIDDVAVVRADPVNRRVLFTRPGQPGMWQADLALANVRQLDAEAPDVSRYRSWTVGHDGRVYYFDRTPDCAAALRQLGEPQAVTCVDHVRRSGPSGFSLTARGDEIYVTLSLWDGGDIGFMPLTLEPEEVGLH